MYTVTWSPAAEDVERDDTVSDMEQCEMIWTSCWPLTRMQFQRRKLGTTRRHQADQYLVILHRYRYVDTHDRRWAVSGWPDRRGLIDWLVFYGTSTQDRSICDNLPGGITGLGDKHLTSELLGTAWRVTNENNTACITVILSRDNQRYSSIDSFQSSDDWD